MLMLNKRNKKEVDTNIMVVYADVKVSSQQSSDTSTCVMYRYLLFREDLNSLHEKKKIDDNATNDNDDDFLMASTRTNEVSYKQPAAYILYFDIFHQIKRSHLDAIYNLSLEHQTFWYCFYHDKVTKLPKGLNYTTNESKSPDNRLRPTTTSQLLDLIYSCQLVAAAQNNSMTRFVRYNSLKSTCNDKKMFK